ncbi:hypothetical protein JYU34_002957 [Plutella xylostella]|uniref:Uncharacterized protein n=1 Tax=Plutella xylostella TaxID=51655 RepID=A0ABQ7R3J1_PLUXY|nr:hypothetical protein JYU34_002957 [Plutella xylostella]
MLAIVASVPAGRLRTRERHVSAHRALRHAAHLLAVIKGVSLETRAGAARDVLDKTTSRKARGSAHRALRHAAHLLAVIKGVSLETRAAAARDVLDKVTSFKYRQKKRQAMKED